MSLQANAGQVEKVLEDLIIRLSRSASTAEVRAALIEAKRLRNVTTRWAAIPPPPDARREMMTRVMELIAQVGVSLSKPPPADDGKDNHHRDKKQEVSSAPPISPKATGPAVFKPTERAMESVRGRDLPKTAPPGPPPRRGGSMPDSEGPPTLTPREAKTRGLTPPPLPAMVARGPTPTPHSPPPAYGARAAMPYEASPMTPRSPSHDSPGPPSSPRAIPPLRGRKLSDAPAPLPSAANAFNSPFRGRTKAGIADEEDPDARAARSRMPTAPPPSPAPLAAGAAARRETKVMGSQSVEDAIDALGEPYEPLPPLPGLPKKVDGIETAPPPSSPAERGVNAMSGAPAATINLAREGRLEGFSSAVSLPSMQPVRGGKRPSNPTMQLPTPVPEPLRGSSPPSRESSPAKPLRTIVAPGVTIVRPEAAQWQAHPTVAGVTLKLLFRDPRTGVYTALLRLAPGATFPRRRHAASEEVWLISGLANVGSFELRAGEYCRAESESVHDAVTTTTGCTLFVCGSEHDEFLDGP